MQKQNILITGGNGYIASALHKDLRVLHNTNIVTRSDFDLRDHRAVDSYFQGKYFDVVIHCAAGGGSRLREDINSTLDDNLTMYYNIVANEGSFGKLISFGSGAELNAKDTLYGLSKCVIRESIKNKPNYYNIRIFGVFDENELETRFIKSNIQRYLSKEPMIIHQDKFMDFFYMKDLVSLVKYYILNSDMPKELNCSYSDIWSLTKIADYINTLGDHKVEVNCVERGTGDGYYFSGINYMPSIPFIGLKVGIDEVYEKLKKWKK